MHVIFDDIIFSLQPAGGISVVWQELLSRALTDPSFEKTFLEYPSNNVCRRSLHLEQDTIELKKRLMERYRSPQFRAEAPMIFHSSYFRILPNTLNITTVHDLTYHYYRHGLPKAVHLEQERYAVEHSAGIICVSENTKQDLLQHYPTLCEDRIRVIYNGVGEHFKPLDGVERKDYILFVGNRAATYKNFEVAVRVAHNTHTVLMIIGAPLTKNEKKYLDETLGKDRYRSVTNLPNEALNNYYNEALCLIYPSDYEGFGIPVIEAQKAGCPVICQETSSLTEIANGSALLIPHLPVKALTDAMSEAVFQLRNGQIDINTLRQKGFENAKRFSWDETYRQTIEFYHTIAND